MALANKNRHGTNPQEIFIGVFNVDRTGLLTGSATRRRDEDEASPDWQWLILANAPNVGFQCVGSSRAYDTATSKATYTYTYEGVVDDPSNAAIQFELDFSMTEEPIATHPNFKNIADKYGYNTKTKEFPYFTTAAATKGTGLSASKAKSTNINPMYGVTSYLSVGAIFRKSYTRSSIPSTIMQGIGTIVTTPPGIGLFQLPAASSGRNWLKMAPKITRRGGAVLIEEEYMLSGPRGAIPDIYSAAALSETGPGNDVGVVSLISGGGSLA